MQEFVKVSKTISRELLTTGMIHELFASVNSALSVTSRVRKAWLTPGSVPTGLYKL